MNIWAVVYGNYEPAEVDSLWATEDLALRREEKLDEAADGDMSMWRVVQWKVGTEDPDGV